MELRVCGKLVSCVDNYTDSKYSLTFKGCGSDITELFSLNFDKGAFNHLVHNPDSVFFLLVSDIIKDSSITTTLKSFSSANNKIELKLQDDTSISLNLNNGGYSFVEGIKNDLYQLLGNPELKLQVKLGVCD